MDKTFKLEIITPYRVFYSGMAEMMIINSVDGELGILPEHESFVTPVVIGPGKIKISGIWKNASVSDGFLEMDDNKVTMLVGAAEWPDEIDADRAKRSLKRAEERLTDKKMPWETKRAELAVKRAYNRLEMAKMTAPENQ